MDMDKQGRDEGTCRARGELRQANRLREVPRHVDPAVMNMEQPWPDVHRDGRLIVELWSVNVVPVVEYQGRTQAARRGARTKGWA